MERKILMTIFFCSFILLTGCWNRRELNELSILLGLGIDKDNEQYIITAQVVNPSEIASKQGGSGKAPVVVYQGKGETLFEAVRKVTTVAPRKLYFAHLRILVFGEELAKEGIGEMIDFLLRNSEIRNDFYITVSKNSKAADVLKILTPLEKIPANSLFASLQTSANSWAPTEGITLDKLTSNMVSEGINPVLTGIQIKGNVHEGEMNTNLDQTKPKSILQYKGMAVFKHDKLIGWMNEREGRAVHFALGKVKSSVGYIKCPQGGKVVIEVVHTKSKLKTEMIKGEPHGFVQAKIQGNVAEVECQGLDLTNPKSISYIEKESEKELTKIIEKAIHHLQKDYQSDIFGFGEALNRSSPNDWAKYKKDWDQTFSQMPVTVKVDMTIRQTGTINNSPLNKMENK
ncbi:Ger(x)C family spore germination protein [Bacillus salipaludis]|uniref:Ger(X)C family spore germination protein n=1 Tax=Bacillus salipaludis TaxID=2547811 RepID=A0A4R5VMG6_9BACI|nr:Ger(x)C family spore germination protein [Bacillus salipaludis]MDQ6596115.1 Ger(x)C family spore germination protein [Bacillus salipaludis]TDK59114.1 Ger(x)C family spore germination protein [Bacillus salipaludis]